jgi:hypothetical protein
MSLEDSEYIKVVSLFSVDDSILFKNQLSYIRVGNFRDSSSTMRIVRQRFCVLDDLINKFPGSIGTVLRYEILDLEQPQQSFMSPSDFNHLVLLSINAALSSLVL